MSKPSIGVLFVCLGNICRSPTAHGVFRECVTKLGLSDAIFVDSCGTGAWHAGEPPDSRAVQAARARGYNLSDLRARQFHLNDFARFNYIFAMDGSNLSEINALKPTAHDGVVDLFLRYASVSSNDTEARHFDQTGDTHLEVPDPYYGGDDGFDAVLDMIEVASSLLVNDIRTTHHL